MIDSNNQQTVGICETQPVTAEGLKCVINSCANLRFLMSASNLNTAMDMASRYVPDVMIVDKAFGLEAIIEWMSRMRDLRRGSSPATIVWGIAISEPEALRLLQNGARGILKKTADPAQVIKCLDAVGNGTTWMEESVFRESARHDSGPRSDLTPRELQVMHLVEQGLKNREIARELNIRPGTVKIHLKHIFEKTGVRGRYGLALTGLKHKGVITMMPV